MNQEELDKLVKYAREMACFVKEASSTFYLEDNRLENAFVSVEKGKEVASDPIPIIRGEEYSKESPILAPIH